MSYETKTITKFLKTSATEYLLKYEITSSSNIYTSMKLGIFNSEHIIFSIASTGDENQHIKMSLRIDTSSKPQYRFVSNNVKFVKVSYKLFNDKYVLSNDERELTIGTLVIDKDKSTMNPPNLSTTRPPKPTTPNLPKQNPPKPTTQNPPKPTTQNPPKPAMLSTEPNPQSNRTIQFKNEIRDISKLYDSNNWLANEKRTYRKSTTSSYEVMTMDVLKIMFPEFTVLENVNYDWNRNPATNRKLELDFVIEPLLFAVEYNGEHHLGQEQQKRDSTKIKNCADKGVYLISIPHTIKTRIDIRKFIENDVKTHKNTLVYKYFIMKNSK